MAGIRDSLDWITTIKELHENDEFFMKVIHPSSISSRETWDQMRELHMAAARDEYGNARAIRNSAELNGRIKDASSQTDFTLSASTGPCADEGIQVGVSDPAKIGEVIPCFQTERARYIEREKLLISQMNAIRNNSPNVGATTTSQTSIDIYVRGGQLSGFQLSLNYNRVRLDIRMVEGMDLGRVLMSGRTTESSMVDSNVDWTKQPVRLYSPDSSGQVSLLVSLIVSAETKLVGMYPMILGEWLSPPFIPSLKVKGLPISLHAIFSDSGYLNLELIVS